MDIITGIDNLSLKGKGSYKDVDEAIANLQDADLAPKKYIDGSKEFLYNQIQLPYNKEPFLTIDTEIYAIREHGNLIFSKILKKYIFAWSQSERPYSQTNVFVHIAIADDLYGEWQIIGRVTSTSSEDPFIVEEDGFLYLLVENKSSSVSSYHDDIGLWKLTDTSDLLNGWSYLGKALEKDILKDWQSKDVSSPTYWREDGVSYLFFEGRGEVNGINQSGAIGLATSDGIEGVFVQAELIISGNGFDGRESYSSWAENFVPDHIWKIGDIYYMSCHSQLGTSGSFYTSVLQSKSVVSGWKEYLNGYIGYSNKQNQSNGSGALFFNGNSIIHESGGYHLAKWGNASLSNIYNDLNDINNDIDDINNDIDDINNDINNSAVLNLLYDSKFIDSLGEAERWLRSNYDLSRQGKYARFNYVITSRSARLERIINLDIGDYTLAIKARSNVSAYVEFKNLQGGVIEEKNIFLTGNFEVNYFNFKVEVKENVTIRLYVNIGLEVGDYIDIEWFRLSQGKKTSVDWTPSYQEQVTDFNQENEEALNYLKGREDILNLVTSPDGTKRLQVNNDGTITAVDVE